MRFLADENVAWEVVAALRSAGHRVDLLRDLDPGASDRQAMRLAPKDTVILTNDLDFGDLVFRSALPTQGVLLMRLGRLSNPEAAGRLVHAVATYHDRLAGAFHVLRPSGLKSRDLDGT